MPLSALKFHFLQITFFPPLLREHIIYPHTLRFSDPLCVKNALYTFFLKLLIFALYSFSLPPKHFLIIFSGKLATKNSQKTSRKEEKFFTFFYNLFHIFPLPLRKKTKPLTFFPLFITGNTKSARENVLLKIFFFFFFLTFFHPTAPRNRKNYHLPFFFEIPT